MDKRYSLGNHTAFPQYAGTYTSQHYSTWENLQGHGYHQAREDHWGPLEAGYYIHKIVPFFFLN